MDKPLVAFNAQLLSGAASYRAAGIAGYIANLLRRLPAGDPGLSYAALLGEGILPEGLDVRSVRTRFPTQRPTVRILWEQLLLPSVLRRIGATLLHAPAFVGPLFSACPQVITVHDLSFLRYPHFFRRGNRTYLSALTKPACRRAAALIAGSEFIAHEITSLLGVPRERIHVIYHGIDPFFHPLPAGEVATFRKKAGLPERFILYVGTLEPRKNLRRLVRAFAKLPMHDVHLIMAGGKGWLYQEIFAEVERLGLQDRVHFPGYVAAETLNLWYNAAEASAYLSLYEGFGFPVLEALACGVPTLASATASLREAAGDGALLAPPEDEDAIAEGLLRLLSDADLRADLQQRGLHHAQQFSWEKTAHQTTTVYRKVIGERAKI
ncbi:MAG: glycosyltransferase family 4 protein [Anaerolineae bacterium]|nr:glycosyltransferase family 4 protein [Anaerolineae bacterium]